MDRFAEELKTMRKYVGKEGKFKEININNSVMDDINKYSRLKVILEAHLAKMVLRGEI